MNLLMVTRRIDRDDWLAGHSSAWAKKLHERLAIAGGSLTVICLTAGNTAGLEGVEIFSLDRRTYRSRWQKFWAFQKLVWRTVRRVDGVFCHQNPEYTIAVWPLAFLFRKKIVSWYTHKAVTWRTRLMVALAHTMLTPSDKSLRLQSPKIRIVGHGIDTSVFAPRRDFLGIMSEGASFKIVSVGRIAPVKDLETLLRAADFLVNRNGCRDIQVHIIGGCALPQDQHYLDKLRAFVVSQQLEKQVSFLPPVPQREVPMIHQTADVFINLSRTGSVDKAVLEAMACECPVITSNEAFAVMLQPFAEITITAAGQPEMLAEKILAVKNMSVSDRRALGANLRLIVEREHGLDRLIKIIVASFQTSA